MLRTRIITALILGAILLAGLFLLPPAFAVLAFGAVFAVAAWEFAGFARVPGAARVAYAAAVALLLWGAWLLTGPLNPLLLLFGLACAWWVGAFLWLTVAPLQRQNLFVLVCGVLVLVPAFIALARLVTHTGGFARGPILVLWLVFMVCAADIGAYFAGRRFGRRKLARRVSPGKTWEGAFGGMLAVAAVSLAGALYFDLPRAHAVLFGCAVGIFSVVGDLTESMFKRAASLKDSGALLPGHGGLLDRIDSVTAAAPLYALGLFGSGVIR